MIGLHDPGNHNHHDRNRDCGHVADQKDGTGESVDFDHENRVMNILSRVGRMKPLLKPAHSTSNIRQRRFEDSLRTVLRRLCNIPARSQPTAIYQMTTTDLKAGAWLHGWICSEPIMDETNILIGWFNSPLVDRLLSENSWLIFNKQEMYNIINFRYL